MLLRALALLGVVLLIWFALTAVLPQPAARLTYEDAVSAALKDARGAYPGGELRILSATPLNGAWAVNVKIALDAHTPCPRVKLRAYELLPIRFREQDLIKDCRVGGVLVYEEEAIIASLSSPLARRAAAAQASAWARHFGAEGLALLKSCPACVALPPRVAAAAGALNESFWLVEWRGVNASAWIALSERAALLLEIE